MKDKLATLVFIPGWGFAASIWQTMAKHISDYPIHYCDYNHLSDLTLLSLVKAVDSRLPHPSILVAWSFGGLIATQLCALYPQKYQKLIVVSFQPKFVAQEDWVGMPDHEARQFYMSMEKNFSKQHLHFLRLALSPIPKSQCATYTDANQTNALPQLALLFESDLRKAYQWLSQPVLQIFGENDAILQSLASQQMQHSFPQYLTKTIPNAGHAPFLTRPELFLNHMLSFIKS